MAKPSIIGTVFETTIVPKISSFGHAHSRQHPCE